MLEKINEINNQIREKLVNREFEIIKLQFLKNENPKEVVADIKINDVKMHIGCTENCLIWGYIKNVYLPAGLNNKEQKELTKYLFCEAISKITEEQKKDIESLQSIIEKLSE